MKRIFILLSVISITLCCEDKKRAFLSIKNESEIFLDSIKISGQRPLKFTSIKSKSTVSETLHYSKNSNSKTDGAYQIQVFAKNYTKQRTFGYHTNGIALSSFEILIKNDTIIIRELLNES